MNKNRVINSATKPQSLKQKLISFGNGIMPLLCCLFKNKNGELTQIQKQQLMKIASYFSVGLVVFFVLLKVWAYFQTHSVSILSGLFDSVQDLLTSLISFFAIRQAMEPADKKHRFGHGKAQAIGGVLQASVIFLSALFLVKESLLSLMDPKPFDAGNIAVFVSLIVMLLTFCLVYIQTKVVKYTQSLSIQMDRAHYVGDVFMNLGVMLSVIFSVGLGWYFVDGLCGLLVSAYLILCVYRVLKKSIEMLMDAEMPQSFRHKIKELVKSYPEVIELHDLKTRSSGENIFIQFCLKLDKDLTLYRAHEITEFIEKDIQDHYPNTQIIIHFEPFLKEINHDS